MAQLRQDYDAFVERGTEVIAVGPDTKKAFQNFWEEKNMPFVGLADPNHKVAGKYEQEVNLLKLGRMPAQIIIDKKGIVRYVHYSNSMSDITENEEILEILDEIEE